MTYLIFLLLLGTLVGVLVGLFWSKLPADIKKLPPVVIALAAIILVLIFFGIFGGIVFAIGYFAGPPLANQLFSKST